MPNPPNPRSPAELLETHAGWIRELARHMVRDSHGADDLAQEACVVAMGHAPRDRARFRPWLASVMKNLVRQKSRGDARRSGREERSARAEAQDATDRLVERVELERELVESVLALDEPYRSAVLHRFFDELPPREIARRLGVPVNTVHSRIARGLARLRERLDASHGERRAWSLLLLPMFEPRPLVPAVTLSGWIMNTKVVVALSSAVLVVSALAVVALQRGESRSIEPGERATKPLVADLAADAPSPIALESAHPAGERAPLATPRDEPRARPSTPAAPVAAAPYVVRGRVLDEQGAGLPGVRIAIENSEIPLTAAPANASGAPSDAVPSAGGTQSGAAAPSIAVTATGSAAALTDEERSVESRWGESRSGAGGRFEFETSVGAGRLHAMEKRWATLRASSFRRGSSLESVLVVARAIDVAGRVEDAAGAPLPNARVELVLPRGFDARFGEVLEGSYSVPWRVRTGERGEFELAGVAGVGGASIGAILEGYEPALVDLPAASARDLVLVMRRPDAPIAGHLRGQVLDPAGAPVEGARVGGGLASVLTDEHGMFALDLGRAVTCTSLMALKPGFLPVTLARPEEPREGETGWPDFVVLRLAGPPLTIEGRVVDTQKHPLAGLRVWLADPTPFGAIGRVPFQIEGLLSGEPIPSFVARTEPRTGDQDGDNFNDSWMEVGPPTALWYWTATDDDGRFRMPGLTEREYALEIMDTKSFVRFKTDPIRAGAKGVEIAMPRPRVHAKLVGFAKSDRGDPLAGVRVSLGGAPYRVRARVFGGTAEIVMVERRDRTVTDADGRFEFENVPADHVGFEFNGEGIVPDQRWITADVDPARYEVQLHTRCNLRVELAPPVDRADAVAVRDADGQPLDVMVLDQGGTNAYTDVRLVDGKSRVVAVSSAARTLVLLKAGVVVESHPLALARGEVNVVRP